MGEKVFEHELEKRLKLKHEAKQVTTATENKTLAGDALAKIQRLQAEVGRLNDKNRCLNLWIDGAKIDIDGLQARVAELESDVDWQKAIATSCERVAKNAVDDAKVAEAELERYRAFVDDVLSVVRYVESGDINNRKINIKQVRTLLKKHGLDK